MRHLLLSLLLPAPLTLAPAEPPGPLPPETTPPSSFAETRVYRHELSGCDPSWGRCTRLAQFCADWRISVMFTDILNSGRYQVTGGTVRATWTGLHEPFLPETLDFDVSEDGMTLVDQWQKMIWTLDGIGEQANAPDC